MSREDLSESPHEEFVREFTRNQRRVFLFILSQVMRPDDADEVLQETNVVALRKHNTFQLGSNFLAWICQIARYEILQFSQSRNRDRLRFSDEFLEAISRDAMERSDEWELRREALQHCLQKLRPEDRELIQSRYAPGEKGKHVAEKLGRSSNSVYQSLGRIRRTLWECVRRQMSAEVS